MPIDKKFNRQINGRNYSFDSESKEVIADGVKIKLDSVYHNEDNINVGIYVCSCTPGRNPGRVYEEDFPRGCQHLNTMRKDGYLTQVVEQLYDDTPKEEKPQFIQEMSDLLEDEECRGLLRLVTEDLTRFKK